MGNIDFTDIQMHAVVSLVIVGLFGLMGSGWCAFTFMTMFWFMREVRQDYEKCYSFPNIWPFRFSTQKWAEFCAGVGGGLIAVLMT